MKRAALLAGFLAALLAAPVAAQDAGGRRPAVERLERIRMERLVEALDLSADQAAVLERRTREHREGLRRASARLREAHLSLERELEASPRDPAAIERALAAIEAERGDVRRLRQEHERELERILSPEQRAALVVFNRRFDARLRELIAQRRGAGGADRRADPGPRALDRAPTPGSRGADADRLRRRIRELERELERLEGDAR